MSQLTEKDRKAQRRDAFRLTLLDDHLTAIGQVALRGGMLDNLIELTAEQLIRRHSPIIRKELSRFGTARKIDLVKEALTQDMPECSNAIAEFFGELNAARSERNEIVHRTWRATDTPEVKALVKVKHNEAEEHVRSVTAKGMIALADRLLDLAIELGDWKMASNNAQLRRSASTPGMPIDHRFTVNERGRSSGDATKNVNVLREHRAGRAAHNGPVAGSRAVRTNSEINSWSEPRLRSRWTLAPRIGEVPSSSERIAGSHVTPKTRQSKAAGSFFFPFCSPWHPIVR